jgi:hypothetical protein
MNTHDSTPWLQTILDPSTQLAFDRCHRHTAHASLHFDQRTICDHILYYVISGEIQATIAGQQQQWPEGTATWVGPGIPQSAHANGCQHLKFFTLRVHMRHKNNSVLIAPQDSLLCAVGPSLLNILDDCADMLRLPGPYAALRVRWRLADCFAQMLAAQQEHRQASGLTYDQRRIIERWLQDHLAHHPTPADLATETHLSPATFRRKFRITYGCSPRTWISQERLRLASELLLEHD